MQLTRIGLNEFRSYQSLRLHPEPGLNVFIGENAAGKTNILESVFLCALGRSHRTRHDAELIRYGQAGALVSLGLQKRTGEHSIECRLSKENRRELKIDGMALSRSGELLGCLQVVMFSPEDLKLIKQGPAERRRFMDMEISQIKPLYYFRLQQYNLALKQRNALLRERGAQQALLDPWDEQLARFGAEIMLERAAFMASLSEKAAALHAELSGGREELQVSYQSATALSSLPSLVNTLCAELRAQAEKDVLRGGTSVGPHRDDILLALDGEDVRAYGSQGQQRTAALSLKLSELALMKELGQESPVLLLDDVLSELDCARQQMLAKAMQGCQTFLTCTQLAGLGDCGLNDMHVFEVKGGIVSKNE